MKAVVTSSYGPPEVLGITELEDPVPRGNEVRIRVRAAAVTISDCIVRSGKVHPMLWLPMRAFVGFRGPRARVLGLDLSGDVDAVGSSVRRFKAGDPVIAFTGRRFGAYGEYVCLPEDGLRGPPDALVAAKPSNLRYEEAAAVPSRGGLAWHFLGGGRVRDGQRVLIYGAAGGVGTFAVQIAVLSGARVTGVCGSGNLAFVESLGASRVLDYARDEFPGNPETYDLIFDAVGRRFSGRIHWEGMLARGGRFISVDDGNPKLGTDDLLQLRRAIESGRVRPILDRVYPLERIAEAHRYVEAGHKRGNVIVSLPDPKLRG